MQNDADDPSHATGLTRKIQKYLGNPPPLFHWLAFFLAYIGGAGIGQGLAIIPGVTVTFWPPSGIFLATLLSNPRSRWLWFVVSGCLAELTCNFYWFHSPLPIALIYFAANSLEALTAAVLIRHFTAQPFRLETFQEVGSFVVWGAGLAPMVGATIIATTDIILQKHDFFNAWTLVWLGDSSGLLVSTPLTMVLIQLWNERKRASPIQIFETLGIFSSLIVLGGLAFTGYLPTAHVMLPPLLWGAARYQLKGAAAALGVIAILTAGFALTGRGSFAQARSSPREDMVRLQSFLAVSAISALIVAVLSQQRQLAVGRLKQSNLDLEGTVADRTASLKESEARLRLFVENAPAAIAMLDKDKRLLIASHRWKEADFFQLLNSSPKTSSSAMLGFSPRWDGVIDRALAGEVQHSQEDQLTCDGNIRWVKWEVRPWRSADGETGGVLIALEDISEIKRNEMALRESESRSRTLADNMSQLARMAEEANRAKSDFLANMSHEIRSPMTAILGYLDLLSSVSDQDRDKIETIRRNGNYLLALINDILDLSRIEAGKLEADPIQFSPRKLVEDVVSLMSVRARESSLELKHSYATAIPAHITSDPTRIRQILINLVGNAIKFTETGFVEIVLAFDATDGKLRFEVKDTGIGMSLEQRERLFLPFEQADSTIARRFGGSGLGLAISQRLSVLLGGFIEVSSRLGQGSQFTLVLPIGDRVTFESTTPSTPEAIADEPLRDTLEGQLELHVLLVDDRRDVRFLTNHFLLSAGCTTFQCENGAEALEQVEQSQQQGNYFDVILMDVQMPVMDGVTAVRLLRQHGFDRPIIALTANAMNSDREMCLAAGFNDWLTKPIDKRQLLETLRRYAFGVPPASSSASRSTAE